MTAGSVTVTRYPVNAWNKASMSDRWIGSSPSRPETAAAMPSAISCASAASGGTRFTVSSLGSGTGIALPLGEEVEPAPEERPAR